MKQRNKENYQRKTQAPSLHQPPRLPPESTQRKEIPREGGKGRNRGEGGSVQSVDFEDGVGGEGAQGGEEEVHSDINNAEDKFGGEGREEGGHGENEKKWE